MELSRICLLSLLAAIAVSVKAPADEERGTTSAIPFC